MLHPKVSIIVSVYKAEKYLSQCIESCLNQTLREIELILVHDGSTDNSLAICQSYAVKDERVIVIDQPNQGTSVARNNGVKIARGEYITIVDGDDWLEHATCESAYTEAKTHSLDMVFWQRVNEFGDRAVKATGIFGEDRLFDEQQMSWLRRRAIGPVGQELFHPQMIDSFSSVWGKLYHIDLFHKKNLQFINQKEVGAADIFFTFQSLYYVKRAKYIHRHFSHYRKDNPNSITKSHGSKLFERFQVLFDKMSEEMQRMELTGDISKAFSNRVAISIMNIGLALTSFRNTQTAGQKYTLLQAYLKNPRYKTAFAKLELKYLSPHWKVFFFFCRMGFAPGVYGMLKVMSTLRQK